ncbi:MAG TPA: hypothetical protein PLD88_14330 [Candidatus Berkiella sp.]|nr:hypothetical protein [Candidatus Berkiella sp.]
MQYKGFVATHYYDVRSGVFIGEIINIPQLIIFSASNLHELEKLMQEAVDDYIASTIEQEYQPI